MEIIRYMTVAEYADFKGITPQAVYKQIKRKSCKLTTKVECGKTLILCDFSEDAGQPIKSDSQSVVKPVEPVQQPIKPERKPVEPEYKPVVKPVEPVQQPDSTDTVEFLKAEIERLHSVIEAEKKEKENLQRTIDNLLELTKQSNFIAAAQAQKQLTEAENKETHEQSSSDTVETTAAATVPVTVKNEPAEPKEQAATSAAQQPTPGKQPDSKPKQATPKQKKKGVFGWLKKVL